MPDRTMAAKADRSPLSPAARSPQTPRPRRQPPAQREGLRRSFLLSSVPTDVPVSSFHATTATCSMRTDHRLLTSVQRPPGPTVACATPAIGNPIAEACRRPRHGPSSLPLSDRPGSCPPPSSWPRRPDRLPRPVSYTHLTLPTIYSV